MIMQDCGIVPVNFVKAGYTLPLYTILNNTGYNFARDSFAAKLQAASRYTAGFLSSYASITLGPSGYAETVLNPNTASGTSFGVSSVATMELNVANWAVYAPHTLQVVNTPASGSNVANDDAVYVPPGDNAVLFPEVNLISGAFGYSPLSQKAGAQQLAQLWSGATLYHGNDINLMIYSGVGQFAFYSGFRNVSVATFQTQSAELAFNACDGLIRMVQIRDNIYGVSRLFKFRPGFYDPAAGCPLPEYVSDIVFGVLSLDTAFAQAANVDVWTWKGGFIFRINTAGSGPTGNDYEFAVTDMDCQRFYLLNPIAGDAATKAAFALGVAEIVIDQNGYMFWTNGNTANRRDVFYAGLNVTFDRPRIQAANLPPISLPCFNPCLSLNDGTGF